jgi:hypothetical protein
MYTPTSVDEYLDLIDQAIFEIEDVLMCAADEGDEDWEFSDLLPLYQQLVGELKRLHEAVSGRRHAYGTGDLPFMAIVRRHQDRIPFSALLEALNRTHLSGFRG